VIFGGTVMSDFENPPTASQAGEVTSLLEQLRGAVADGDVEAARASARRMLEDDTLALLENLPPNQLGRLFAGLGDESLATLVGRLDDRFASRRYPRGD
jgi:hypothetical protein